MIAGEVQRVTVRAQAQLIDAAQAVHVRPERDRFAPVAVVMESDEGVKFACRRGGTVGSEHDEETDRAPPWDPLRHTCRR